MTTVWMLLLACHKAPPATFDPDLPEGVEVLTTTAPREILEEAAGSESPTTRAAALEHLVALNPAAFGPRALFDPSPWVQRAAVHGLLTTEDRELLLGFVARPSADPYVRGHAALRMAPTPELLAALKTALEPTDAPWRRAPLAHAAWIHGDDTALNELVAVVATGELPLEPGFLADLARRPDPALVDALTAGAQRAEEEAQLAYAAARLGSGDPDGETMLRRALDADLVGRRLEVVELAAGLGEAGLPLLRRAKGHRDPLLAAYAESVLAAGPGEDVRPLLEHAIDPDDEVRELALMAIASRLQAEPRLPRRTQRQLQDVVLTALTDPDSEVRVAAIQALPSSELEALRPLLADPAAAVRIQAAGRLLGTATSGSADPRPN